MIADIYIRHGISEIELSKIGRKYEEGIYAYYRIAHFIVLNTISVVYFYREFKRARSKEKDLGLNHRYPKLSGLICHLPMCLMLMPYIVGGSVGIFSGPLFFLAIPFCAIIGGAAAYSLYYLFYKECAWFAILIVIFIYHWSKNFDAKLEEFAKSDTKKDKLVISFTAKQALIYTMSYISIFVITTFAIRYYFKFLDWLHFTMNY
ncbi:MAG: hypothetical protein BGO27_01460 [Alphaproteobacteria bacterium 33-17]|nr:MAG: hypothetical protein BGO27_01460 [Alphaproteobacteria bacterium 33-17]